MFIGVHFKRLTEGFKRARSRRLKLEFELNVTKVSGMYFQGRNRLDTYAKSFCPVSYAVSLYSSLEENEMDVSVQN